MGRNSKKIPVFEEEGKYHYAPDMGLEISHTSLALKVSPRTRTAVGNVIHTVKVKVTGARRLALNAVDMEEINVESQEPLRYDYDGKRILILLRESRERGHEFTIKINYKVVEPVAGLYFSYPDSEYPERPIYAATDHESERARHWIPCVDLPSSRPTWEMFLTADEELTILAMGQLIEEKTNGDGTKTSHWRHDFPCPSYIAAFAIGKFSEYRDRDAENLNGEKIPVAYYADESVPAEALKLSFGRTPEMIEWMCRKVNLPIAWPKYYQFALRGFSGAMENQSLVSWDDQYLVDSTTDQEFLHLFDSVNVHELAHTFFGDMVVVRDFGHAWLKESWATYVSALWLEEKEGDVPFKVAMYRNARAYFEEADVKYVRPIVTRKFRSSWEMFDGHLYPGGSWRIHMLRRKLGDEEFWRAVHEYLLENIGKTVETVDFQRKLQEHCAENLDRFFDDWIYMANKFPDLKIETEYVMDREELKITVVQKQVKEFEELRPFEFEFPVHIHGEEKRTEHLHVRKEQETFVIPLHTRPRYILFDPEQTVLFRLEWEMGDRMAREILESSGEPVHRILAFRELVNSGKSRNVGFAFEQLNKEDSLPVIEEMMREVGNSRSLAVIDNLVAYLSEEHHPRAQLVAIRATRTLSSVSYIPPLKQLVNSDRPIIVSEALQSLAEIMKEEGVALIRPHVQGKSWMWIREKGAVAALGKTRSEEAAKILLEESRYGAQPLLVRENIPAALVSVARYLPLRWKEETLRQFQKFLHDPMQRVQLYTARAMKNLALQDGIPMLKELRTRLPHQEQVNVDDIISHIRKTTEKTGEYKELIEKIESIEKRLDKIASKVDRFESSED